MPDCCEFCGSAKHTKLIDPRVGICDDCRGSHDLLGLLELIDAAGLDKTGMFPGRNLFANGERWKMS